MCEKYPPITARGSSWEEEVDKNIAVTGGFAKKTIQEAERLVREMMTHANGFGDVSMTVRLLQSRWFISNRQRSP